MAYSILLPLTRCQKQTMEGTSQFPKPLISTGHPSTKSNIFAKINGGGSADAVDAFIEFLLSDEINKNMPENNYMYSVLEGEDLPEENGYRYHSPVPTNPAEISTERIDAEMETWIKVGRDAAKSI